MQKQKKEELGWILAKRGQLSTLSIDIDKYTLDVVKTYIKKLQEREDVGTAVIVESSDLHYHVYFFWRFMEWEDVQELVQDCPIADNQFQDFTRKNGFIRMRISNLYKPYIEIINHNNSEKSDIGDFYFRHYLYMVGFAPETIEYYLNKVNQLESYYIRGG